MVQLFGYILVDIALVPHAVSAPLILESISQNQLFLFLLANLMTGGINIAMRTLLQPDRVAVAVMLAYMLAISLVGTILHRLNIVIQV